MKTIIELYDNENIFNISAAAAIKPENIVFICGKRVGSKRKAPILSLLGKYSPRSRVYFYHLDSFKLEELEFVLEEVLGKFPDCAVELTGGTEVLAYGVGKYAADKNLEAFVYNAKKGKIIFISGENAGKQKEAQLSLDIQDFAVMAGGRYLRHGHFDIDSFSEELLSDSERVWKIFVKYKDLWHKQVGYFQAVSCTAPSAGCLKFSGAERIVKKDGGIALSDSRILKELENAGILKNLVFSGNNISFEFKNQTIKNLLNDFGVWLEIFIYKNCLDSGKFDNVDMSVVLDWNKIQNERDDVLNEIDVVVTKGVTPLFVSCKAGNVSAAALNEIKTLTERFGGGYAKAVLVTAEELSSYSIKTYKRALELGIRVVELGDLAREEPSKILERIIENG